MGPRPEARPHVPCRRAWASFLKQKAEAFNIFNSGTVLQRFRQINSTDFQRIDEILSPRIVRFGARFTF